MDGKTQKFFPDYFEESTQINIRKWGTNEEIPVYRVGKYGKNDSTGFLNYYDEAVIGLKPIRGSKEQYLEKYFENVCNVGDLNLEKVFMKFEDENILFICRDGNGERFLGVCYELRYTLKWVLCRITNESILQVLVDNITVHECFRKADELLIISYSQGMGEKSEWTTYEEIERRILPDEDFHLKYDMKKDVYYLNIIYEMFREQKNAENFMEINADSFMQKKRMMQTERISKNAFVVRKKRTHEVLEQNANKKWVGYCA